MKVGERLLTTTVDHFARTDPSKPIFSISTGSPANDYVDISFERFANSVNRLSWWLQETIGLSDHFETICYYGPPDLLYFIFTLAACKCGYKALFTSPRNSIEAHVHLFKETDCRTLFGPESATISKILSQHKLEHRLIKPLEYWLEEARVEDFPQRKSYHDLAQQPFVVHHTSGTTGLPKPINTTHGVMSVVDKYQDLPPVDGREVWVKHLKDKRVFCCLPPFHAAGNNLFVFAICFGTTLVLPPASQPPDLNLVEMALENNLAEAACMAPSILEEISESPLLEKLRSWEFVAFGGSPLSKIAGDKLWDVTKVFNLLGSTETYNLPELEPNTKDEWQYHAFHPLLGLEFEERSEDRYEAVFRRKENSVEYQGCFQTFKEKDVYPMGDLYSKHPSKAGLWLYRGRADDTVVLSNGEKFNPQDLESIVGAHPDVRAAITVGNGRTQPALVIEPEKSLSDLQPESQQIERIWDTVAKANDTLPGHAQIDKEHIAILSVDDQMPRSSKGAIQRQPFVTQKQDLIDELYSSAEEKQYPPIDLDFENPDALKSSLLEGIQANLKNLNDINTNSNLFESGLDSLQAVQISRMLRSSLESTQNLPDQFFKPALIYKCPTIERLAEALSSAVNGEGLPPSPAEEQGDAVEEMQTARKKYAYKGEQFKRSTQPPSQKTVILTGSTGRLGSYLLHSLLSNENISKVYCLGRSPPDKLRERQLQSQEEKGLSCDFESVAFHQFDVEKELWGLKQEIVDELVQNTTHIIHNAWPVNFNHNFESFNPQLQGCQNLLQLASKCSQLENLFFVSSVGAANNYGGETNDKVPEEAINDMLAAESMGYAQSKLVAELLFTDAAQSTGLPTTICRVGQIAGAVLKQNSSSWNQDEWFPSLMKTSKTIGKIPKTLGAMEDINWLPSDILGDILVQMTLNNNNPTTTSSETTQVLHAVNPKQIQWSTLLADLQQKSNLLDENNIEPIEFTDWISAVSDKSSSDDMSIPLDKIPAVKLLDFYEALLDGDKRPIFDTAQSTACSAILRDVSCIKLEWLEKWIGDWI